MPNSAVLEAVADQRLLFLIELDARMSIPDFLPREAMTVLSSVLRYRCILMMLRLKRRNLLGLRRRGSVVRSDEAKMCVREFGFWLGWSFGGGATKLVLKELGRRDGMLRKSEEDIVSP
jgi:hypothetical protein